MHILIPEKKEQERGKHFIYEQLSSGNVHPVDRLVDYLTGGPNRLETEWSSAWRREAGLSD